MAIHATTRRVVVGRDAAPLLAPSGVGASPAPPLTLGKPNAVRVVPLAYGAGRSAAIPLSAPKRRAPTTPASEALTEVGANRK